MMIDSSSSYSSEEEICQEETSMTLNQMTEPCYNYTTAEQVCEVIQISGQLHIQHLPCHDHCEEEGEEGNDVEIDDRFQFFLFQ